MADTLSPSSDKGVVEARLAMPLAEAMLTQRAVRRVNPDPVDDGIVLRCLELALEAPTSSNGQNWEFVIVKDQAVKAALAAQYRRASKLYESVSKLVKTDEQTARILKSVHWQVEHFEQIPVLVVCCLRGGTPVPFVPKPPIVASSHYGSIYPSVQNLLLAATRRRPRSRPHHHAALVEHRRSADLGIAPRGRAVLHRDPRLGKGPLWTKDPQAGRHSGPPRPLRASALARPSRGVTAQARTSSRKATARG